MSSEQTLVTKDRLMDLERTVAALNSQLRTIQWGLQRTHSGSLRKRFWSFMKPKPNAEFMSAVCNQQARLNMKRETHESPRA
jgi:hypothetical protein